MLELINVKKQYDSGQEPVTVLDGINLRVAKGESIAVIGPSGSGKSTLLNIIGALDTQSEGEVLFDGINLKILNENETALFRNRKIGFVFQEHHLLPQCTVLENVLVPAIPQKTKARMKDASGRAAMLLERVGLRERANDFPGQLSVGERQRVAVVRALINMPLMILADEPTGSLDNRTAEIVCDLLIELNKEQKTSLVVVTHSLHIADKLDRIYELSMGKLVNVT